MAELFNVLQGKLGSILRDRRIAASDEYFSTANAQIYGKGTRARSRGERRHRKSHDRFSDQDAARNLESFSRSISDINTIILHSTDGPIFVDTLRFKKLKGDGNRSSNHRIDKITAHFVVTQDGQVFYTRDVRHILNTAGGKKGIDIEFAGRFSRKKRVEIAAINSGRNLVLALTQGISTIAYIHPHGQVQKIGSRGKCGRNRGNTCRKINTCPGPDIWTNVGDYSVKQLSRLTAQNTDSYYQNNGITQTDERYRLS